MLVQKAVHHKSPVTSSPVDGELTKARQLRRARKGLDNLGRLCEDVGINSSVINKSVLSQDLRSKEIEEVEKVISRMSPRDIFGNLSKLNTFRFE